MRAPKLAMIAATNARLARASRPSSSVSDDESILALVARIVANADDAPREPRKRKLTQAMADAWAKMGVDRKLFAACLANLDEKTYRRLREQDRAR